MKTRLLILISIGFVLILSVGIYWQSKVDHKFSFPFSEPRYEGESLSYWVLHVYSYNQSRRLNPTAQEAILHIGTKALPLLLDWISRPEPRFSVPGTIEYQRHAVNAFEILGPIAKPAIPSLIKIIGQNRNFPDRALLCIGKDAVLPLADRLVETLSDTNYPFVQGAIRMEVRKTSGFYIRGCILKVLSQMGTNAEAAVPALIKCLNSKTSHHQAEAAGALASVGRNQPDIVMPVLINAFTNANLISNPGRSYWPWGSGSAQSSIVGALGSLGGSSPNVVIPFLINVLINRDAKTADRGAIAGALAQAGRDKPNVILPVLIYALTNGDARAVGRDSIAGNVASVGHGQPDVVVPALIFVFTNSTIQAQAGIADALATLGSEAQSAIPFLLLAGQSADWQLRARAAIAVKKIAPQTPNALAPLIRNLEGLDSYARYRALYELGRLGTNGVEALPALAKFLHNTNSNVRYHTERCIEDINQFSDDVIVALGENLSYTNSFAAELAESILGKFADRSKLAFVTLAKTVGSGSVGKDVREQAKYTLINISRVDATFLLECLDDPDASVRSGTLRVFYDLARLVPDSIPILRRMTANDPDLGVRSRAVDVLKLQLQ